MPITVDRPIRAGRLPPEIRGDTPPDTLVRVSYEIVRTEDGFTPEQEADLLDAVAEADRGEGLSPRFGSADAMLDHLRRNVAPPRRD